MHLKLVATSGMGLNIIGCYFSTLPCQIHNCHSGIPVLFYHFEILLYRFEIICGVYLLEHTQINFLNFILLVVKKHMVL